MRLLIEIICIGIMMFLFYNAGTETIEVLGPVWRGVEKTVAIKDLFHILFNVCGAFAFFFLAWMLSKKGS